MDFHLYTYLLTIVWDILIADVVDDINDASEAGNSCKYSTKHMLLEKSVWVKKRKKGKFPIQQFDIWKHDVKQSNTCVVCIYVLFHAYTHTLDGK